MLHIFSLFILPLLLSSAEAKKGGGFFLLYFCLGDGCSRFQQFLTIVSIMFIFLFICAHICICTCAVVARCCSVVARCCQGSSNEEEELQTITCCCQGSSNEEENQDSLNEAAPWIDKKQQTVLQSELPTTPLEMAGTTLVLAPPYSLSLTVSPLHVPVLPREFSSAKTLLSRRLGPPSYSLSFTGSSLHVWPIYQFKWQVHNHDLPITLLSILLPLHLSILFDLSGCSSLCRFWVDGSIIGRLSSWIKLQIQKLQSSTFRGTWVPRSDMCYCLFVCAKNCSIQCAAQLLLYKEPNTNTNTQIQIHTWLCHIHVFFFLCALCLESESYSTHHRGWEDELWPVCVFHHTFHFSQ